MRPTELLTAARTCIRAGRVPLILGSPGIGKTSILELLASLLDLQFRPPVIPSQLDAVDIRGLPIIEQVDGHATSSWTRPFFFPPENGKPSMLFIDEFTSMPPSNQPAFTQLLLERRIGDYALPKSTVVVAAGNRVGDRCGVFELMRHVANRVIQLPCDVSHDDWHTWAVSHGIAQEVRAFLLFAPQMLNAFDPQHQESAFPSPRSNHAVSDLYLQLVKDSLPATGPLAMELYAGAAGSSYASMFCEFLLVYQNLPDIDALLADPETYPLPDPRTNPSVTYAVACALVERVRSHPKKGEAVARVANRYPLEYAMPIVRDCLGISNTFLSIPAVQKWIAQHANALRGHLPVA